MIKIFLLLLIFWNCSSPQKSASWVIIDYVQRANNKEELKSVYEKIGSPLILIEGDIFLVNSNCVPEKILSSFRYYTAVMESPREILELYTRRQISGDIEKSPKKKKESGTVSNTQVYTDTGLNIRSIISNLYGSNANASLPARKIYACRIADGQENSRVIEQLQPTKASIDSMVIVYDGKKYYEFPNGEIR